jgi:probable HAF family extracellular repeat protein
VKCFLAGIIHAPLCALAVAAAFTCVRAARAAVAYDIIPLNFNAADINDAGQIAGTLDINGPTPQAIRYDHGVITPLENIGGTKSSAATINAAGDVAGVATTTGSPEWHAFRYTAGAMQDLGSLGGIEAAATGINAAGTVVGWRRIPGDTSVPGYYRGFYYDNSLHFVGTLGGASSSVFDINDAGQMTGGAELSDGRRHAFRSSGTSLIDLGTVGSPLVNNSGIAINASGQIAGNLDISHVMFHDGTTMFDLGTLGGFEAQAADINDSGQIVGESYITGDSAYHAFLYAGGQMTDINDLIDPSSGWLLQHAEAINNKGQIIGHGFHEGAALHFLLTPVPEPTGLASATVAAALFRRRCRGGG